MSEESKNSALTPGISNQPSHPSDNKGIVPTTNPTTTAQSINRVLPRSPGVENLPTFRSNPSYLTDLFAHQPLSPPSSLSPAISTADNTDMVENWPQDRSNDGPS